MVRAPDYVRIDNAMLHVFETELPAAGLRDNAVNTYVQDSVSARGNQRVRVEATIVDHSEFAQRNEGR